MTVHQCLDDHAPRYLSEHCIPVSSADTRRHLRSANRHLLAVPRFQLNTYGRRHTQLLARRPGTHSRSLSRIQRAAQTVLGVYLKRTCSHVTSASSALGVLNDYALYKSRHSLTRVCHEVDFRAQFASSSSVELVWDVNTASETRSISQSAGFLILALAALLLIPTARTSFVLDARSLSSPCRQCFAYTCLSPHAFSVREIAQPYSCFSLLITFRSRCI